MASALSYRQNCACACKTLQAQRGQTHGAGCVRQWFRTAELLEERRYENWSTHTHWCNNSEPDWTDARGPVPRLWMHSTEVRGGGGGGGGGGSVVGRMGHNNSCSNSLSNLDFNTTYGGLRRTSTKTNFMPVHEICIPVCCLRLSRQQSLMGNRRKADDVA